MSVFRKTVLSLAAVTVVAIVLATMLLPQSPVSPLTVGEPSIPGDLITDERGELTDADRAALSAVSAGAAVDYPSPADFFANRGVAFNYVVPTIENFGYPTGTHGQNRPVAVVLHIAQGSCAGMQSWFATGHWVTLSDGSQVYVTPSTQFGVCEDGSIDQYLEIEDASHGQGVKNGLSQDTIAATFANLNPNLLVVSVEIAGKCEDGILLRDRPKQETSLIMLLGWFRDNLGITLDTYYVIGHFDIDSVNRPIDPLCLFEGGKEGFRDWVSLLSAAPPATLEDRVAALEVSVADLAEAIKPLLPTPSPTPVPTPTPTPTPTPVPSCSYTVHTSDFDGLSGIASRELDDWRRWGEIAILNGLSSPYVVNVGQVLTMPC